MGTPFMGEVKMISWNYPPKGWAFCNGQLMPINQNQALFSLYGTTFGGDGRVNFGLPDLRGRVPVHAGNSNTLGTTGGEFSHTLTQSELPQHFHFLNATNTTAPDTGGNIPANTKRLSNSNAAQLYAAP